MNDSPQDKGGPDPCNAANSYWQNLLGFPIDPWLGISDSALKECYGALGVVSARWNRSEAQIRFFTAHYAGIPEPIAPLVMRHLNNLSMTDLLLDCSDLIEKDSVDLREAIEFLCKLFSRCRENRNTLSIAPWCLISLSGAPTESSNPPARGWRKRRLSPALSITSNE
jgi:hypothetical protein